MRWFVLIKVWSVIHSFFLLFDVITKCICIYFPFVQEVLHDRKVLKFVWIFSILASIILVILEFSFVHDIETTTIYKCTQHQWKERQQARYFTNFIFIITIIAHVCLQLKIKQDQLGRTDPFFDNWSLVSLISFIVIILSVMTWVQPTIENVTIRIFLQISFVDFFVIRLLCKLNKPLIAFRNVSCGQNVSCNMYSVNIWWNKHELYLLTYVSTYQEPDITIFRESYNNLTAPWLFL